MNEDQAKEQKDYMNYLIQNEKRKMNKANNGLGFGFVLLLSVLTSIIIAIIQFAELQIGSTNNSLLFVLMAILGVIISISLFKKIFFDIR